MVYNTRTSKRGDASSEDDNNDKLNNESLLSSNPGSGATSTKSPIRQNGNTKVGASSGAPVVPPPPPTKPSSNRSQPETPCNKTVESVSNGAHVVVREQSSMASASVTKASSGAPTLDGTQMSPDEISDEEEGCAPIGDDISLNGGTTLSSLGTSTLSSGTSTNSAKRKKIIPTTPDAITRYLMTKSMPGNHGELRGLVSSMGEYIGTLHSQINSMSVNMEYLAETGARQGGKSRATVQLAKKEYVMKGMIDRGLDNFVWRKRAFFLKAGWHGYATKHDSFCQLFMKWAELRDVKPEMYGGEEILWDRFVVPLIAQLMMNKRSNLYRKVHDWWESKCMFSFW